MSSSRSPRSWRKNFASVLVLAGIMAGGLVFFGAGTAGTAPAGNKSSARRATPGTLLATVHTFSTGPGVSVAFDGSKLYYTHQGQGTPPGGGTYTAAELDATKLYSVNTDGTSPSQTPIHTAAGAPVAITGELAWDDFDQVMWGVGLPVGVAQTSSDAGTSIYTIKTNGEATFRFDATPLLTDCTASSHPDVKGCKKFVDGLAWDGSDRTLWYSPDATQRVYHFKTGPSLPSGQLAATLDTSNPLPNGYFDVNASNPPGNMNPPCPTSAGQTSWQTSGIVAGTSSSGAKILYLAGAGCHFYFSYTANGQRVIPPSTSPPTSAFSYDFNRAEGMECDNKTFKGTQAVWIRDDNQNQIVAFELPADYVCPVGGPPVIPPPVTNPCCDLLTVQPFPNFPLQQSGRTFTITNPKTSPICYIEVKFHPTTPTFYSGGGPGQYGGILVDGVEQVGNFSAPYLRIPGGTGNLPSPGATSTVVFNLGVNWTIGWAGSVEFVVHHCDDTTCTLEYGDWVPKPGKAAHDWKAKGPIKHLGGLTLAHLSMPSLGGKVAYTSLSTVDPKDHLLADAGTASGPRVKGRTGSVVVAPYGLRSNSVLYKITRLPGGNVPVTLEIAVRRAPGKRGPSALRWLTFDKNANPIGTGVISLP